VGHDQSPNASTLSTFGRSTAMRLQVSPQSALL
jgi:hypothetical protein